MAHEAIPRAVRRQVRDRAGDCCEYCRHPASYSCAPFVCEHVLPRVLGAGSTAEELAWSCPACNGHKYDKTRSRDPQTGQIVPLFNPRRQRWSRHFAWRTGFLQIEGRTATGARDRGGLAPERPGARQPAPGLAYGRSASSGERVAGASSGMDTRRTRWMSSWNRPSAARRRGERTADPGRNSVGRRVRSAACRADRPRIDRSPPRPAPRADGPVGRSDRAGRR